MRDSTPVREPTTDESDALLSTVRLSAFGLKRESPRPLDDRKLRHEGFFDYDSLFDYDTLFYDVFRTGDGSGVICLGPPLLNCEPAFADAEFRIPGAESPVAHTYQPPRLHFQPSCRFRLSGPDVARAPFLILNAAGRSLEIPVRSSGWTRFAGRRIVTTLSKNSPLAWIGDWAEFYVRVHGADAILLYDNGSTDYDLGDIHDRLKSIDGLADALIVPWKFPYGPGVGPRNVQDSFYCQPGALDHARRRYCAAARSILNSDIDELVVTRPGDSIFERAERSGCAAMVFSGIWVEKTESQSTQPICHTDFRYRRWDQALWPWARFRRLQRMVQLLRTKWIAVPSRCDDDMEWGVHDVYPASESARADGSWKVRPRDFVYRHFRQLTIGPNSQRKIIERYSPFRHLYDRELAAAFNIAFAGRAGRDNCGWRNTLRRIRSGWWRRP